MNPHVAHLLIAMLVATPCARGAAQTGTKPAPGRDAPAGEDRGSKTPPVGPPWTTDFLAAHRAALAEGKPIFVYSTKTH